MKTGQRKQKKNGQRCKNSFHLMTIASHTVTVKGPTMSNVSPADNFILQPCTGAKQITPPLDNNVLTVLIRGLPSANIMHVGQVLAVSEVRVERRVQYVINSSVSTRLFISLYSVHGK